MGFEPTDAGATIRCVDRFATIAIWLTGVVGLEPTLTVLETAVLPIELYPYMRVVEGGRFELPNPMGADLQSAAFSHFATPPLANIPFKKMVARDGIEPPTQGFSVLCSTD